MIKNYAKLQLTPAENYALACCKSMNLNLKQAQLTLFSLGIFFGIFFTENVKLKCQCLLRFQNQCCQHLKCHLHFYYICSIGQFQKNTPREGKLARLILLSNLFIYIQEQNMHNAEVLFIFMGRYAMKLKKLGKIVTNKFQKG